MERERERSSCGVRGKEKQREISSSEMERERERDRGGESREIPGEGKKERVHTRASRERCDRLQSFLQREMEPSGFFGGK